MFRLTCFLHMQVGGAMESQVIPQWGREPGHLEWDQKLFSAFVGNEWVEPVINYFNEQQKQFGEKAFILGATSMHLGSGNISNDSWRMAADAYSRSVFQIYPKNKRSMMSFN